ncbi:hypothetical protein [Paenibacillus lutrae]|uniref:Mandelate racemase/muconate lactonizing enzyme N-terminal domain-containing protein n=1 Tax=Paenibacillus lutrae TaxID=2078573 RepID=A0A7X3FIJ9_9BACL|nr:hypothetical protein [Paenibacillus lutrae]MVP00273.1 hypothetical protein [Paenibacillus lutrae]
MEERITGIQLFEVHASCSFHYRKEVMENCRYGLLKLTANGVSGWGECIMAMDDTHFDILKWSKFLYRLKNLTLLEALNTVKLNRGVWGTVKAELVEMAVLDIIVNSQRMPLTDPLLKANRETAVSGEFAGAIFQPDIPTLMEACSAYFVVL